jgi:hypothetical protein
MHNEDESNTLNTRELAPEARYAYYRRCQRFRNNGLQCKAPALKGNRLCYKHDEQDALDERRKQAVRELGLHGRSNDPRNMQEDLWKVAQALVDGHIDAQTTRRLLVELQGGSRESP